MTESNAHHAFTVVSPRMASLVVTGSPGTLGFTLDGRLQEHRLGRREAPAYRVAQPFSPDDGWAFEPLPQGRLLDDPDGPPAAIATYAAWSAGSRAQHGSALIEQLPDGQYLLVRSPRRPTATERVLFGNELVAAPANVRVLQDQPPVYACLIGATAAAPPDLTQPLLGLAILNYVGASWMHGVVFFQLTAGVNAAAADADERDLVLVIPVDGELVIDNLGMFAADGGQAARATWRDAEANDFARWCAG